MTDNILLYVSYTLMALSVVVMAGSALWLAWRLGYAMGAEKCAKVGLEQTKADCRGWWL